ncbi:hypothetical protein CHUAL_008052 [Chamberlinius hualienensis]
MIVENCAKYTLFIFSILELVAAVVAIGYGIYFIDNSQEVDLRFTLLSGILGAIGSARNNKGCLLGYAAIMGVCLFMSLFSVVRGLMSIQSILGTVFTAVRFFFALTLINEIKKAKREGRVLHSLFAINSSVSEDAYLDDYLNEDDEKPNISYEPLVAKPPDH